MQSDRRQRAIQFLARSTVGFERPLLSDVSSILQRTADLASSRARDGAFGAAEAAGSAYEGDMLRVLVGRGRAIARAHGQATITLMEQMERKGLIDTAEQSAAKLMRERGADKVVRISEHTKLLIRSAIEEGRAAGENEYNIAARIMKKVGTLGKAGGLEGWPRAERIARTEAHFASQLGAYEAAKASGARLIKEWGAVEDTRTRRAHAIVDGQQVEFDAHFIVGGVHMLYPGEWGAPASQVVWCRCQCLYIPKRFAAAWSARKPKKKPAPPPKPTPTPVPTPVIPAVPKPKPQPAPSPPAPAPIPPPAPVALPPPTAPQPPAAPAPAQPAYVRPSARRRRVTLMPWGATWTEEDERAIAHEMPPWSIHARSDVLSKGIARGIEFLAGMDESTGLLVAEASGTRGNVVIPPALLAAIDDPKRRISVHHNHPGSSSFSTDDLIQLSGRPGMSDLWAHGHDGSAYRARRRTADYALMERAHKAALDAAWETFNNWVQRTRPNNMNEQLANSIVSDAASIAMHVLGLIDYQAFFPAEKADMLKGMRSLSDRLVDDAKDAATSVITSKSSGRRRRHPWEAADVSWVGPLPGRPMPTDAVPATPEEVTDPAMLTGIYDD